MPQAKSLKDLLRIRAHNRTYLESINGNLGTALGFRKPTGGEISSDPAVIVFVPLKINPKWLPAGALIPDKLDGPDGLWCHLDVVEGGKADTEGEVPRDESDLAERLRGWDSQIWAGAQVAHWTDEAKGLYSLGTLGAFARRRSDKALGLLTNKHVALGPGQKLYHPVPWGTHLATTAAALEYVADEKYYGPFCDEPDAYVRVDCAFAKLVPGFPTADLNPQLMGVGKLGAVREISLDDMSIIGQKVLRVGRTTGLRRGAVVAFSYEWSDETGESLYTDLLIAGAADIPFSTHGDSGSLILTDDDEHRPVGLLWGGWDEELRTGFGQEKWTWGIALSRVLDALGIDLVTEL